MKQFEHCLICVPFFAEMVGAVIVVFILAVLYEGLKTLRELLLLKNITKCIARKSTTELSNSTEKPPLNSEEDPSNGRQVFLSAGVLGLLLPHTFISDIMSHMVLFASAKSFTRATDCKKSSQYLLQMRISHNGKGFHTVKSCVKSFDIVSSLQVRWRCKHSTHNIFIEAAILIFMAILIVMSY